MSNRPNHPIAYHLDFARRSTVPVRPRRVLLAEHLQGQELLRFADALIKDMRSGAPLNKHLSPLKNQRSAFKRSHRKQDWLDYKRFMDHLFNKWGFRHFHCGGGSVLVFVHLCERTDVARVLDLVPHNGSWLIEKHLVEIAVRNWPEADIATSFGMGSSKMTEADFLAARKQGLNMTVNVDGIYYLPARGALMSDGSGHGGMLLAPYFVTGRRFEPGKEPPFKLDSPNSLVLGLDPDDLREPGIMAAGQMGLLTAGRARS